jgi:3-methylcrotonyl-CoA carboxylase alpha subunit
MIAKLIVHGENRNDALRRFRRALEDYQIVGPHTNISFIKSVAEHKEFIKGEVETGFIEEFRDDLFKKPEVPDATTLAMAADAIRLGEIENATKNSKGKVMNGKKRIIYTHPPSISFK